MAFPMQLIGFALAYWIGAELAYVLLAKAGNFSVFWPPAGICLGMLLATPRYRWWAVMLAGALPNLFSDIVVHGQSIVRSSGFLVVNLGAPLVAAIILDRLCQPIFSFTRLAHVSQWVLVSAFVSAPLGAMGGATIIVNSFGGEFPQKWFLWWVGDLLGTLALTPLAYEALGKQVKILRTQALEIVILMISLGAATIFIFRLPNAHALPPAVLFLFLLWAALRFGAAMVSAATTVLAVLSLWMTGAGYGPYTYQALPHTRALMSQVLAATGAFLFYILTAVIAERRAAENALQESNVNLEEQVRVRTAELLATNKQLRTSETSLQLALDASQAGAWSWDVARHLSDDWDERFHAQYGFASDAPRSFATWMNAVHPDDRLKLNERLAAMLATPNDDVWHQEFRALHPIRGERWMLGLGRLERDSNGQPLRVRGLNLDITARKQQEEALRTSRTRLAMAMESANIFAWEIDVTSNQSIWSDNAALALGFPPDAMPRTVNEAMTFNHPDDDANVRREIERVMSGQGRSFSFEQRLIHPLDQSIVWVQAQGTAENVVDGKPSRIVGLAQNITTRKRGELELAALAASLSEQRELLAIALRTGQMGAYEWRVSENTLWWSPEIHELFGVDPVTFTPSVESFNALVHPDDRAEVWRKTEEATAQRTVFQHEYRIIRPDGETRWLFNRSHVGLNASGEVERVTGMVTDITERKQAEEKIRQSVMRSDIAQEAARATFYEFHPQTDAVIRSDSFESLIGYTTDEVSATGTWWQSAIHPDDLPNAWVAISRGIESCEGFSVEYRARHKDGHYVWLYDRALVLCDEQGKPERVVGMIIDITARIESEENLRLSEDRFQRVFSNNMVAMGLWTKKGGIVAANDALLDLIGYTRSDLEGGNINWVAMTPPEYYESDIKAIAEIDERGICTPFEKVYLHKTGRPISVLIGGGRFDEMSEAGIFYAIDITKRKQAETKLREQQELIARQFDEIEAVYRSAPVGLAYVDRDLRFVRINERLAEINGVPVDETVGRTLRDILPASLADYLEPIYRKILQTGEPVLNLEVTGETLAQPGALRAWIINYYALKNLAGEIIGVNVVVQEITERKKVEETLRESEEFSRTVMENNPDCVKILDQFGRLQYMNANGLCLMEIDDFSPFVDQCWSDFWAEENQQLAKDSIEKALQGQTSRFQAFCATVKGTPKWWDVIVSPIRVREGKPARLISVSRDVTAQKRAELNLTFLANLQTDFAPLLSADQIMSKAGERIAAHFNLTHCLFVEIDESSRTATVLHDEQAAGAVNLVDVYDLANFHTDDERQRLGRGETLVIKDVRDGGRSPSAAAAFESLGIRALVTAPFIGDSGWRFALSAHQDKPREWREDEFELLRELAARIYLRIERARAEADLQRRNLQLDLLSQVSQELIVGVKSETEILQTIFDRLAKTLETEFYFNYMIVGESETLRLVTSGGLSEEQKILFATIRFGQYLCGTVAQQKKKRVVEDLQTCEFEEAAAMRKMGVTCYAGFPLIAHNQLIGTVAFATRNRACFRPGELQLIQTVCDQAAITVERARAEENLRASEERMRLATDAAEMFAWENDLLQQTMKWSDNTSKILGYAPTALPTAEADGAFFVMPKDRDRIRQTFSQYVQDGHDHFILEFSGIDGRFWQAHCLTQRDDAGQPVKVIGVTQDITARHQLLAREQHARELAEAANRAKDDWLAMVTHELRTPLNPILGQARLLNLRRAQLDPELLKFTDLVLRNGERQNELIHDLLDTARISTGKLQLEPSPVNLNDIIRDALDTVRASAQAKGIQVRSKELLSAATENEETRQFGESAVVWGDAARLQQVVWNLLTNAIKFTPAGGIVSIDLNRTHDHVIITVQDTGAGIASEFLPHVFERFSQQDTSRSRRYGGLGLGLALVKQIVEMHGGTITATSAGAGHGATFTVTLPVQSATDFEEKQERLRQEQAQQVSSSLLANNTPLLRGVRIVLVEDTADSRELITTLLVAEGASVQNIGSSAEAWSQLTNSPRPDVLICSTALAAENGFSLLKRLRQWEQAQGHELLPALALIASGSLTERLKALQAGYQMHISKPLDPQELILVLQGLYERKQNPSPGMANDAPKELLNQ